MMIRVGLVVSRLDRGGQRGELLRLGGSAARGAGDAVGPGRAVLRRRHQRRHGLRSEGEARRHHLLGGLLGPHRRMKM